MSMVRVYGAGMASVVPGRFANTQRKGKYKMLSGKAILTKTAVLNTSYAWADRTMDIY